jgi:O-antigen/teichoic acid export membrane protein
MDVGNEKISKSTIYLTISKFLNLFISLVTSMLLSRFRSISEYGTFSQINVVISLATALLLMGLPNAINYFYPKARSQTEKDRFISVYFTVTTSISIMIGIILVCSIPLISWYFKNTNISDLYFYLFIIPWTRIIISSFSNVMIVSGRTNRLVIINTINSIMLLVIIILTQIMHKTFIFYLWLYVLVETIFTIFTYTETRRATTTFRIAFDNKLFKEILKYTIPLGIATVVGTLNIEMDKLMIGRLMDTEAVAIYANAGKELPLNIISSSLITIVMPRLVVELNNREYRNATRLWGTSVELSYIFMCFFSMVCIVFAPQIMVFLYSEKYVAGISVFRLYSFVMLLRTTYYGMALNAMGQSKYIFIYSVIALIVNIILNYIFYYIIGFSGPAVSTFVSSLLVGYLQLLHTSKMLKFRLRDVFPWSNLLKITIVNIIVGVLSYILLKIFDLGTAKRDIIISIVTGFCIMGGYFVSYRKKIVSLFKDLDK